MKVKADTYKNNRLYGIGIGVSKTSTRWGIWDKNPALEYTTIEMVFLNYAMAITLER